MKILLGRRQGIDTKFRRGYSLENIIKEDIKYSSRTDLREVRYGDEKWREMPQNYAQNSMLMMVVVIAAIFS